MKQKIIIAALLVLALSLSACTVHQSEEEVTATSTRVEETTDAGETQAQTEEDTTVADSTSDSAENTGNEITEEEALAAAEAYLGDTDQETGYKYSFASQGIMEDTETGEEFYRIRVSWYLPEDDRYSVCGYLLVSMDGETVSKFDW
ncbi:MAG: hypothetical protein KHW59_01055 [Clostridiales bacterium]|nr:hypothetical protein [Clostridiales bacterium]